MRSFLLNSSKQAIYYYQFLAYLVLDEYNIMLLTVDFSQQLLFLLYWPVILLFYFMRQ
jgi:hypothetical protein